jgi:hypothetical protein
VRWAPYAVTRQSRRDGANFSPLHELDAQVPNTLSSDQEFGVYGSKYSISFGCELLCTDFVHGSGSNGSPAQDATPDEETADNRHVESQTDGTAKKINESLLINHESVADVANVGLPAQYTSDNIIELTNLLLDGI